jgi:DNA-binding MarR family transcriptional regulator
MSPLTAKGRIYREILAELFRLRALMLESAEQLTGPVGLTSARWQILAAVEETPSPVAQVARGLGLTRQAVQETADAMVREGHVTFFDNPGHKRARLMTPTLQGRKALDYLRPREMQFANVMGSQHSLDALRATLSVLQESRATIEARAVAAHSVRPRSRE